MKLFQWIVLAFAAVFGLLLYVEVIPLDIITGIFEGVMVVVALWRPLRFLLWVALNVVELVIFVVALAFGLFWKLLRFAPVFTIFCFVAVRAIFGWKPVWKFRPQ